MSDNEHLAEFEGLAFETGRDGTIKAIGVNNWNIFAHKNGAPELEADAVLGRNLFDFIEGTGVRNHVRAIMDRVAQDPSWVWVIPFRCDAPDRARQIRQSVSPVFSGDKCTGFIFQSLDKHSQRRPRINLYDFKRLKKLALEKRDLPCINMCSWCQRVQSPATAGESWLSAEDYYAAGGKSDVRISHGICEDCAQSTMDPFAL